MRAYHRIDPLMDERKGHYSPSQFGAFLKVQLMAGRQTRRGRFRSLEALKAMLPRPYAALVEFLVSQRDIVRATTHPTCKQCPGDPLPGEWYVDGWDEWQEGDLTVKDRMARLRNRQRNGAVTEPYLSAIGVSVGVGTGVDVDGAASAAPVARPPVEEEPLPTGEEPDGYLYACRLLGSFPNLPGFREEMTQLDAEFGAADVEDALGRVYSEATLAGIRLKPFELKKGANKVLSEARYKHEKALEVAGSKALQSKMADDIRRQEEDAFRLCSTCGQRKGSAAHGANRDHEFAA